MCYDVDGFRGVTGSFWGGYNSGSGFGGYDVGGLHPGVRVRADFGVLRVLEEVPVRP